MSTHARRLHASACPAAITILLATGLAPAPAAAAARCHRSALAPATAPRRPGGRDLRDQPRAPQRGLRRSPRMRGCEPAATRARWSASASSRTSAPAAGRCSTACARPATAAAGPRPGGARLGAGAGSRRRAPSSAPGWRARRTARCCSAAATSDVGIGVRARRPARRGEGPSAATPPLRGCQLRSSPAMLTVGANADETRAARRERSGRGRRSADDADDRSRDTPTAVVVGCAVLDGRARRRPDQRPRGCLRRPRAALEREQRRSAA